MLNLQVGNTGTLNYSNGTSSKVIVVEPPVSIINTTWFWYDESETNRPIIHEDFENAFPIPNFLLEDVFEKDQ